MTHNFTLMDEAKKSLEGKWGYSALTYLVFSIVSGSAGIIPILGPLLISGALTYGFTKYALSISRNDRYDLDLLFDGFKRFGDTFIAFLLMAIFVFLWSLLFVIPGIIASLSYSMTFYIMNDNPELKPMEAIDESKKIMYGYKWKLFLLYLNFTGWFILCVFTLFIGFFWLIPYVKVAIAKFYEDIRPNKTDKDDNLINTIGEK